jgi:hypothetical protein
VLVGTIIENNIRNTYDSAFMRKRSAKLITIAIRLYWSNINRDEVRTLRLEYLKASLSESLHQVIPFSFKVGSQGREIRIG